MNGDENFKLTNEHNIDKNLSIDIKKKSDSTYEIRRPFLIQWIID